MARKLGAAGETKDVEMEEQTERERVPGRCWCFISPFFSLTFVWREMKRFPGLFTFRLFMREPGVVSTLEQTTEGRIA